VKATIDAMSQEVLADLKRMGAEATEEARQLALDIAKTLELVGASGATDEMVRAGRETIELKVNTLRLRVAKALIIQQVDAWIKGAQFLTRLIAVL